MNRIAWLLAVLTLIPSAVLAQAATGEGEPGSTATAPREEPEDGCGSRGDVDLIARVEELVEPKEGRVGVVLYGHSAVFRLPAEHPCLERWVPLILQSLDHGTFVRMSFENGGTEITRVTSATGDAAGWDIHPDGSEGSANEDESSSDDGASSAEDGEGSEPAPDREEP